MYSIKAPLLYIESAYMSTFIVKKKEEVKYAKARKCFKQFWSQSLRE